MLPDQQILILTILLPLFGVGLVWALAPRGRAAVRASALITSLFTLVGAGLLVWNFPGGAKLFAASSHDWLAEETGFHVQFSLALDGLSIWLFALSALLVTTSILVSWTAIKDRPGTFYAMLLLLEVGMLGVFAARDILLFYVFFEFTLIPLFFLIGIWGSEERRYAAMKFFIFTLLGSVLTFLGLLSLVLWNANHTPDGVLTFSIDALTRSLSRAATPMPAHLQVLVFLALSAGFAVKVPLFPVHTWLPLAHTQAPTAGSILLAGVLLKIGTYGFLRFNMAMLPEATAICAPYILWLAVAGIIYGALVALVQKDIKKLIAYSSVSHLGYVMLGLFALNRMSVQGGTLQMINHGLSTGGLFACVGLLYERYHSREIRALGGLAREVPILAFFMLVFTFASIGVPGLNGFAGEFLVLIGMFQRAWTSAPAEYAAQYLIIAVFACLGVVLGAWYMLWLVQRTFFGELKRPASAGHEPISDLGFRESLALTLLVVPIVCIGVKPQLFLAPMQDTLNETTELAEKAFQDHYHLSRSSESAAVAQQIRQTDRVVAGQSAEQRIGSADGNAALARVNLDQDVSLERFPHWYSSDLLEYSGKYNAMCPSSKEQHAQKRTIGRTVARKQELAE